MAMLNSTVNQGFSGSLTALRARFDLWLRKRRVYNSTVDELSMLSNRELADIAIGRADIRRLAREAAEQVI